MSKQRSLQMTDRLDRFIEDRIGQDHYETAEDVVEAGLLLLEEQEREMKRMCDAWDKLDESRPMTRTELIEAIRLGEESGDPVEVDFDALFEEVLAEAQGRS